MEIYAFKDIANTTSSSGGAFPAIIKAVEEIEGRRPIVYGAAFDEKFEVEHIRATSEEDFLKLRGSKYVKSIMRNSISNAVSDLLNREVVIFSGTPCQIAGMKKRVEHASIDTSKLYLVEIICHGTPQPVVWRDFRHWIENEYNSRLTDFSFRYSKARWKSYPTMAEFENGKRIVNGFKLRRYTELFYSNLTLEKVCYGCKFASTNRISDVTIGDFWGIRRVIPAFPFKEEVSQVLFNTPKGISVRDTIEKKNSYLIQAADLNVASHYQSSFNQATFRPSNTDEFWKDYENKPFEDVLRIYAGYNTRGRIRHVFKRFLGETKLLYLLKTFLGV